MSWAHRIAIGVGITLMFWGGGLWERGSQAAADPCDVVPRYPGVCLDPGHGGPNAGKLRPPHNNGDGENKNRGACGPIHIDPDTCVNEAWVNHEIVPLAVNALHMEGVYAAPTRQTIAQNLRYQDRCDAANNDLDVDLFVSIHHEGTTAVHETRTFYANTGSNPTHQWRYKLAQALAAGIDSQFHYGHQVMPDDHSGGSYYVLRNTWMPAALTEASSLGHMSEALLMASDDDSHRRAETQGIVNGLFSYEWDTAPMFLTCRDLWPFPGFELSWWAVEGADGYAVYVYEDAAASPCPPTEPSECYVVEAATSCILFSFPSSPAIAVRAYVEYPPEGRRFVGGFSSCYGWWNDYGNCFPFSIDRMISIFTATGGEHRVTLSWHAVSFEEWAEFEIWRSTNGGQSYDDSVGCVGYEPDQDDYCFVDTTTGYWMTYHYKIRDTEGYDWWGPASARPASDVVLPPVPSPPPVLEVSCLDDQEIHLCLAQGSQYADSYHLRWEPEGGAWEDTVNGGEPCIGLGGLLNGTAHWFTARGLNPAGMTDFSSTVWAVPTPAPADLHDEAGYECIRLWWDGDCTASGYRVYYSTEMSDPFQHSVDIGDTTATTLADLENGTLYYVCVVACDPFGNETGPSNSVSFRPACWGGAVRPDDVPVEFKLEDSHPNPFGCSTTIAYELARPCARVSLVIYDTRGREVQRILDMGQPPGRYQAEWDGRDSEGQTVPAGVYFCRLEAGRFSQTSKLLLVK
jgi:N-acetylmuramoyl-L-alanine amidase